MRATGESELLQRQRRRREGRDGERGARARRTRRRRQSTPWLQRNALSVAAASILIAFLGLGFGLLEMLNRPEPAPALLAAGQSNVPGAVGSGGAEASGTSATLLSAASLGTSVQVVGPSSSGGSGTARAIDARATVLQPNYTIAAGDTLVQIARRFNTTVERIQALNNLSDPRVLRIGTRLVIPPPL